MIRIRKFVFNTFKVNCYLLYDETDCIIIDASCYEEEEKKALTDFIDSNKLKLIRNISTHCHMDHILGNDFIARTYGILPEYHQACAPFLVPFREIAASFNYFIDNVPQPKAYLSDGEIIRLGKAEFKVLYTPGHADGSICLYQQEQKFVITGDVLFRDTIGRTDLPSGNYDLIIESIRKKLFTLPDDVVVLPGHGSETSIGHEKINNPFIR